MSLPFIIGGVSAAGSLIGDLLDKSEAEKNKRAAIKAYQDLLIPDLDTKKRADMYGDDVYTKAMGELNEGAFSYQGALNPETLRTIAFAKMAGARSQTEIGVREQDFQYNRGIKQQIAGIKAQPTPGVDFLGIAEAGVGGYFSGKQLEMSEQLNTKWGNYIDKLSDNNMSNTIDYGFGNSSGNFFLPRANLLNSQFKSKKKRANDYDWMSR